MTKVEMYIGADTNLIWSSETVDIHKVAGISGYRIVTKGQKIIISNPQLLIYNEGINTRNHLYELGGLFKTVVDQAYKDGKQTILFYTPGNRIFKEVDGRNCRIVSVENGITTFMIDDMELKSVGLDYLVITRNEQ